MALELSQTEVDCLRQCLLDHWLQTGRPTNTLRACGLTTAQLAAIPLFDTYAEYAEWTIAHALEEGFSTTPAFIIRIALQFPFNRNATALTGKLLEMQEEHERNLAAAAVAASHSDPFQPIVMRRLQPVLGREKAGRALRLLSLPNDAAVFVVSGIPRSGRSYTAEIVNHAAWHLGQRGGGKWNVATAELEEGIVDRYEAVSFLASSLGNEIDRREVLRGRGRTSPIPSLNSPGDLKWLGLVAQWLVSAATNTGEAWWLVLDRVVPDSADDPGGAGAAAGGSVAVQKDPVDQFIQILARRIAKLVSGQQVRLVVLGYAKDFPSEIRAAVVRESLPNPGTVGSADVELFFKRYFDSKGGWEQGAVDQVVSRVFSRLDNTGDHLASLNASIREVLNDLNP